MNTATFSVVLWERREKRERKGGRKEGGGKGKKREEGRDQGDM